MRFEAFLAAELATLGRFAGALTGDRDDAHDVLVDALIKVSSRWEHIQTLDHRSAYVRRVIVTTYLSDRRRRARRRTDPTGDLTVLDGQVHDWSDTIAGRDWARRTLHSLPPRQRAALVLRFYLDLDDASIAAELDTSTGNVRSLISRGLARLRMSDASTPAKELQ